MATASLTSEWPIPGQYLAARDPAWVTSQRHSPFLGFTHFCGVNSKGHFVVWRHTAAKRMRAKLRVIHQEYAGRCMSPSRSSGVAEVGRGGLLPIPRRAGQPACAFAVPRTALPLLAACSAPAQSAAEARLGSHATDLRPVDSSPRTLHPYPDVRFDARIRGRSRMR